MNTITNFFNRGPKYQKLGSKDSESAAVQGNKSKLPPQRQPNLDPDEEGKKGCLSVLSNCVPCLGRKDDERLLGNIHFIGNVAPIQLGNLSKASLSPLSERCEKSCTGWDKADPDFDWANVQKNVNQAAQNILEAGIQPMLQELLGDAFKDEALQSRLQASKESPPRLYDAFEFGLRSTYKLQKGNHDDAGALSMSVADLKGFFKINDDQETRMRALLSAKTVETEVAVLSKELNLTDKPIFLSSLELGMFDKESKLALINEIDSANLTLSNLNAFMKKTPLQTLLSHSATFRKIMLDVRLNHISKSEITAATCAIQGQAINGIPCINTDKAEQSVGLHLLTHEIMHTIADPKVADALRALQSMGDEGPNEFFARLASIHLKFDENTSTQKTPYTIIPKNASYTDTAYAKEVKAVAKAYFLGTDSTQLETVALPQN